MAEAKSSPRSRARAASEASSPAASEPPRGEGRSQPRSKDPWRKYLQKRRLKTTQQREAIVDAFLRSTGHVNLEDLLSSARKKNPGVGLATVYRTVKLLEDAGLAASRQFGSGQTLYEVAGHHHDHIICQHCQHIIEFESDEIERIQSDIARRHGFEIVNHRHELFGLCAKAQGIPGGVCPMEAERGKKK